MSDLIDRQAAVNDLYNKYHGMISDESMKIYQIVNWLDSLPSAQQWVPVTEGLPIDLQVVNITYINREPTTYYDHIKGKPMVATAVYYRKRFYWYSVACVDVLGEYGEDEWDEMDDRIEVKAWMPLPTHWKGEE